MPLITPKTDWIAGDSVGFSDMNRIEGNVLYLQNENKTINGTNTFTGASTFSSTLGVTGLITVGATGITGATNDLILNTNTGNTINIQVNSVDVAIFSGSQIDLLKPVEANGNYHIKNASSDTIGAGSLYRLSDSLDSTKSILHQLSADGHLDTWLFFDGSWRRQYRMVRDGRHVIGFNKADNGTDLLQVGSDDDISVSLGRGKLFSLSDGAYFSHYDFATSSSYAIGQTNTGSTYINCASTKLVGIYENNSALATFSGTQIDLLQKLTLEGESTFSVDFSGTREILQIRSKDVLANGAGINLYGSADSVNPDKIILYADSGVNIQGELQPEYTYKAESITEDTIFGNISSWVPSTNDFQSCSGQVIDGSLGGFITGIERTSTTQIKIHYISIVTEDVSTPLTIDDGDPNTLERIDIKSIHTHTTP